MIFLWILLIAHFLICLILLLLRVFKVLNVEYIMILIAFFIPIWGIIMLIYKVNSDRHEERKAAKIELERPVAEEEKKSISVDSENKEIVPLSEALVVNDESTRRELMVDILYNVNSSVVVDDDEMIDKVVPLDEALVVNDTATRRALIIDVLYNNPSDYVSQLYNAKANGDTEVVHYAATALTEIQKEFDLKFQEIAERKAKNPDDEELDDEYQQVLENYISSRLLEGDALKKQLRIYSDLLEKKIEKTESKARWSLLNKKANADLKLEDTDALDKDINLMQKDWADREGMYMFKMQNAILKKDVNLIHQVIDEIHEKNIYLSSELRGLIRFWEDTDSLESIG